MQSKELVDSGGFKLRHKAFLGNVSVNPDGAYLKSQ